jgi:bifunctional enzyme CysN/CysC
MAIEIEQDTTDLPLRLPIQEVENSDQAHVIVGRIESGRLRVGDMLLITPSDKLSRVAAVVDHEDGTSTTSAQAGQTVAVTLEEQIYVERGEVAASLASPPAETNRFKARVSTPLEAGSSYELKIGTATHSVRIEATDEAEVVIQSRSTVVLDAGEKFELLKDSVISANGVVLKGGFENHAKRHAIKSTNIHPIDHRVPVLARQHGNGHKSGVLWMTGLSGSGKTTLALGLEQRLFKKGYQVYVLDGDNVRQGLNGDLSFAAKDRTENIRRVGEVAKLFADAGFIVIAAFISPYQIDRDRAREIQPEIFHEVHIKADLETCEDRDPKGLYKKARAEGIPDFTGISAPYEAPGNPELEIDTVKKTVEESIQSLVEYIEEKFSEAKKLDVIG